jgi:hypothetical protein
LFSEYLTHTLTHWVWVFPIPSDNPAGIPYPCLGYGFFWG